MDRQKKIDSFRQEVFSSVTHNLKTPLNCMMLMLQSAIQMIPANDVQFSLREAYKNGDLL